MLVLFFRKSRLEAQRGNILPLPLCNEENKRKAKLNVTLLLLIKS